MFNRRGVIFFPENFGLIYVADTRGQHGCTLWSFSVFSSRLHLSVCASTEEGPLGWLLSDGVSETKSIPKQEVSFNKKYLLIKKYTSTRRTLKPIFKQKVSLNKYYT